MRRRLWRVLTLVQMYITRRARGLLPPSADQSQDMIRVGGPAGLLGGTGLLSQFSGREAGRGAFGVRGVFWRPGENSLLSSIWNEATSFLQPLFCHNSNSSSKNNRALLQAIRYLCTGGKGVRQQQRVRSSQQ